MLDPRKTPVSRLMSQDVLTLEEDMSIEEGIRTLEEYHITGAPVTDAAGKCVGVFSTTNILERRVEVVTGETPRAGDYFSYDPLSDDPEEYFSRDDYDDVILGRDTVGQWMTTEIKSVRPSDSIEVVCRLMVNERIHRVLVTDGTKLEGILTTFDVVRLVAGVDG